MPHSRSNKYVHTSACIVRAHEGGQSSSSSQACFACLNCSSSPRSWGRSTEPSTKLLSILCQVRCRCCKEDDHPPPPPDSAVARLCCCCYFGCCASRPALYLITEISINKRASEPSKRNKNRAAKQRSSDTFCQLTWLSVQLSGEGGG